MMKLSEAIRKGAALRPQGHRDYVNYDWKDGKASTCALGAAYEAITYTIPPSATDAFEDVIQVILNHTGIDDRVIDYPSSLPSDTSKLSGEVLDIIITLNDTYEWTREQIADWLETQGY